MLSSSATVVLVVVSFSSSSATVVVVVVVVTVSVVTVSVEPSGIQQASLSAGTFNGLHTKPSQYLYNELLLYLYPSPQSSSLYR